MDMERKDLVANWMKENRHPAIEKLTNVNLETAGKVAALLTEKGLDAGALAHLVDTQIAEINKWLNGKHNFSEKTLAMIMARLEAKN